MDIAIEKREFSCKVTIQPDNLTLQDIMYSRLNNNEETVYDTLEDITLSIQCLTPKGVNSLKNPAFSVVDNTSGKVITGFRLLAESELIGSYTFKVKGITNPAGISQGCGALTQLYRRKEGEEAFFAAPVINAEDGYYYSPSLNTTGYECMTKGYNVTMAPSVRIKRKNDLKISKTTKFQGSVTFNVIY